jgi:hypothetical protein
MKRRFAATAALLITALTLLILCFPWQRHPTGGISDNLWTSSKDPWNINWANPDNSGRVLLWDRSEYGIHWHYLVIDKGIGHPAWYARLDLRVLIINIMIAVFIGAITFIILNTGRTRRCS